MNDTRAFLRDLFNEAAEIADTAAREAFLDSACKGDLALRARVQRLLAADSHAGNFLRDRGDTTTFGLVGEKIGERIGRYRLIERIGKGGCGVVYLAEQEEPVRRRVALKIIKLGMDTQTVVSRFEAERQALALMDHPNIARVFDAGATETGRPFFVMELVSGLRITEYCERHQLSVRKRLELFITVCHAVQHAHQKGVIHRDLKPSNILVAEHDGVAVPKVIDFGIAKATAPGAEEEPGLTKMDQFLGTPAYMSPEQVDSTGPDIDTRSDIYSLGVIIYELLAGQPPFDPKTLATANIEEIRRTILEVEPPRPSTSISKKLSSASDLTAHTLFRERLAALRGDLDWIVMKCLEKDRSRRYQTANGLAADIRRHLDEEPVMARPPSRAYRAQKILRRNRLAFSAAGIILGVLVAAVFVSSRQATRAIRAEKEQSRLRSVAESKAEESRQRLIRRYVSEGNRLTEEGRPLLGLPWMVAALELEKGDPQREADERVRIGQTLIGAPELLLNLPQGKSVHAVALNADGGLMATGSDDGTVRISHVMTGNELGTRLTLPGSVRNVRFSPDGKRLVGVDDQGHSRIWSTTHGETLTPLMQAADFNKNSIPGTERELKPAASFSPDGKLLLLAYGSKSAQLRDGFSGELLREFTHKDLVYHAAFSVDGRYVVTSSKDNTAQVWDALTGKLVGPPLQHTGWVAWAQFSSDGNKLLTVRERRHVQLWDWREGRRIAPEIPRRSILSHASLSPDDTNILTAARSGYAQLYDAASSRFMYQFYQHGGLMDAAFSPNGGYIATACQDGNAWIFSDTSVPPMVLPQGNSIEDIDFSGDGRRLAVAGRGGHTRIWELFPAEHGTVHLQGNDVQWVDFDATGRRALVLSTGDKSGIAVYDAETAKRLSFVAVKFGRAIFNCSGDRVLAFNNRTAVVFDANSGHKFFSLSHQPLENAAWTPDGKFILTAAARAGVRAWDAATGKLAFTFPVSNSINNIAISPDGKRVALGNEKKTAQIWEFASAPRLARSIIFNERIRDLAFSPDGQTLAISTYATSGEGIIELRNISSGEPLGPPLFHRENVTSFQFSRNGRWLASSCKDHTARVWDAFTGQPITGWLPHSFEALQVAFSPDSTRLATRERRGAVRLWNTLTGEPLTAPLLYPRNTGDGHISYSPDGQRLLLCRGANEACLRDLRPESASIGELKLLAQVLSCTRFDPASGMVPINESELTAFWNQLHASRFRR